MDTIKATLGVGRENFLTLIFTPTTTITGKGSLLYTVDFIRKPKLDCIGRMGRLDNHIVVKQGFGYIQILIEGFKAYIAKYSFDLIPFPEEDSEINCDSLVCVVGSSNVFMALPDDIPTMSGQVRHSIVVARKATKSVEDKACQCMLQKQILHRESRGFIDLLLQVLTRYTQVYPYDNQLIYE